MKKLLMFGLVLIVMFGISFNGNTTVQNNVEKLMALMKSGNVKLWNNIGNKILYIYENTGQHDYFETTYKKHYAFIEKGPNNTEYFTIVVRDYRDYYTVHDARGFILVGLADFNNDGKVDKWAKNYVILLDEANILSPPYPPGYINPEWSKMTREEAQKIFDAELNYILENVDKAEAG